MKKCNLTIAFFLYRGGISHILVVIAKYLSESYKSGISATTFKFTSVLLSFNKVWVGLLLLPGLQLRYTVLVLLKKQCSQSGPNWGGARSNIAPGLGRQGGPWLFSTINWKFLYFLLIILIIFHGGHTNDSALIALISYLISWSAQIKT